MSRLVCLRELEWRRDERGRRLLVLAEMVERLSLPCRRGQYSCLSGAHRVES